MKILLNARNIGCVGLLVEGPDISVSPRFVSNRTLLYSTDALSFQAERRSLSLRIARMVTDAHSSHARKRSGTFPETCARSEVLHPRFAISN